MQYAKLTITALFKDLKTSEKGLTFAEAAHRLKKHGPNALPHKKPYSAARIFLNQLKSPLVYVLLMAALISVLTGDASDAEIIIAVVLINSAVGYWQESKAQKTLSKLKEILPPKALVRREGDIKLILADKLVPGDVIILQTGEKIVADARIIKTVDLTLNESFLTGESRPVKKYLKITKNKKQAESSNLVFAGSVVQYGQGEAVVIATGVKTKLGDIAGLIKGAKETATPLQKRIKRLANHLVIMVLGISLFIFLIGIFRGYNTVEMFRIAVAVAVAAIPEGLLIAITVILAIGMQRILKRKALVRQLLAAETLGSTSVICTDKTGTLTEGSMKVVKFISLDSKCEATDLKSQKITTMKKFLEIALYCNDAVIENYHAAKEQWKLNGRPTDRSLLQLVIDNDLKFEEMRANSPRLTYLPFDSQYKFMATLNKYPTVSKKKKVIFYMKGAPEVVLRFSSKVLKEGKEVRLTPELKERLERKISKLSGQGFRVLAGGYKVEEAAKETGQKIKEGDLGGMVLVGFYVIADPLRPEAKETIKLAKAAGIKTVMITGDHAKTARAIASELEMPVGRDSILTGEELQDLTDDEFEKRVKDISVYARVSPKDKLRIVDAWQKSGFVVAMTGDGINDAPALKIADVGIAIGSGTTVAKETADMVLLDDNFKTIVEAVREGRVIFSNVKKVTLVLLSSAFAAVIVIIFALIANWPLPLVAAQILWVNIITDGLPDIALTAEPGEKNILKYKPVNRNASILDLSSKIYIAFASTVMATAVLIGYLFAINVGDIHYAQSFAFTVLASVSLFAVYSIRDIRRPIWQRNIFDNPFLLFSIAFGFLLQIMALYLPFFQRLLGTVALSITDWLVVLILSLGVIGFIEALKWSLPLVLANLKHKADGSLAG